MKRDQPALFEDRRASRRRTAIRRRDRQPLTDLTALPAPVEGRAGEDRDFLPAAVEILETPPPLAVTLRAYLLCGALIAAILWTIFFSVSTYAVAPGKILAVGDTKVVQPLEAGQVSAIRVKEGDSVNQNDVLVELNPTEALAARAIIVDKLVNLRAEMARRRVETSAARAEPVDVKAAIAWEPDIPQKVREREDGVLGSDLSQLAAAIQDLEAKRKVKEAARDSASTSIAAEKSLIAATTEQLGMHQQLETKGWDSHVRVLEALEPLKEQQVALATLQGNYNDAVAAIPVIDSQIASARESFVTDDIQKVAAAERQVEDLKQQLTKADQMVANMKLRAPIAGTVHAVAVTSVGQAVTPGQQIMQVVPSGATLQVVAYVLNTDIGFVLEGQPAVIKVDTFPYTRYGVITGKVTKVATDAITGTDALNEQKNGSQPVSSGVASATGAAQQTNDLVFPVEISLSKATIDVNGKSTALSPGMSVVAEITTGEQRIISYVMYPLVRGAPPKQDDQRPGS
jgi:hemolysin D